MLTRSAGGEAVCSSSAPRHEAQEVGTGWPAAVLTAQP